uniref:Uncharacterized protein n=1 Tax=Entomoneis paludosa TaxID=265537 RepID=A0A7S3DMV2_9STRA|mmetsp:Transcript_21599/g.45086  ORF Transcript_21599/g.45086 Transcript_21599/m.45086 type:complete len:159 (+) Transcript_21599:593-1069(+)
MFHYNDSPNSYCPPDWEPPSLTDISNLTFINIDGRNSYYIDYKHRPNETFHFMVYDESPIRNLYMEDVYFPDNENGMAWNCNAIERSFIVNNSVQPWPPCSGFTIIHRNSQTTIGTDWSPSQLMRRLDEEITVLTIFVALFSACATFYWRRRSASKKS